MRPAIIAVDDDPQVLAAVRRDLRRHYDGYQVIGAESGRRALEALAELKKRGDDVALLLVDQRMPEMTGTQFILQARTDYPDAKRVLLTAYADTDVAIQSINEVGLDHYLMKPWDPPEDVLYPILDDLLDDWLASHKPVFHGVRVVGPRWSAAGHDLKDFLARNQVPYRFVDIERDRDEAESLVGSLQVEFPALVLPDGEVVSAPDLRTAASKVGLHTEAASPFYDVVVVGAGPAGLGAAVYGASEGLRTAVIERLSTGGQAGTSSRIENYLGFPAGISGGDLARRATAQASRFGAEIITALEATSLRLEDLIKVVGLSDGSELRCHALIVASGMTVKTLDLPGHERFMGRGVFYGATVAEARTYDGANVFVVGGANSAGQAVMMFSRFAKSVAMVVRGESLEARMSAYLIDQIRKTEKIEVLLGTRITEVRGNQSVEAVLLETGAGEEERPADGVFIFIGARPHTDFLEGVVELNPQGFIITGADLDTVESFRTRWPLDRDPLPLETSVPGIFAAGDVAHGVVRRVATAVGHGAMAVAMVHRYLATV